MRVTTLLGKPKKYEEIFRLVIRAQQHPSFIVHASTLQPEASTYFFFIFLKLGEKISVTWQFSDANGACLKWMK